MFCFASLYTLVCNICNSKKNCRRCDKICVLAFTWSAHYSCQMLMEVEFSGQIFSKRSSNKFKENPSSGSQIVTGGSKGGRTDRWTEHKNLLDAPVKQIVSYKMTNISYYIHWVTVHFFHNSHMHMSCTELLGGSCYKMIPSWLLQPFRVRAQ